MQKHDLYHSDEVQASMWFAINKYHRGVEGLTRLARSCRMELDDMLQVARMAAWRACIIYDGTKGDLGNLVISYVRYDVRWFARRYGSLIRISYDKKLTDRYDFESYEPSIDDRPVTPKFGEFILANDTLNEILEHCSPRQKEIVLLLAQGHSQTDAARILGIKNAWVQIKRLRAKLTNSQ